MADCRRCGLPRQGSGDWICRCGRLGNGGRRDGSGAPPKVPYAEQIAIMDQMLAADRARVEATLGRLRRVPPLRTPEQPYHPERRMG